MPNPSDSAPNVRVSVSSPDGLVPPMKERRSGWDLLFGSRRRLVVVGAVALLIALGGVFAVYSGDRAAKKEAVDAMESFLLATRDGDLDEAHKFMSDRAISHHHEDALDPAVYASEWEIGDIELIDFNLDGEQGSATVSAEIIGPNDTRVSDEAHVVKEAGSWHVANPYSTISVSVGEFRHVHINGQQPQTPASSRPSFTYVLPGAYTFDDPDVDLIEMRHDSVLVIGNSRALIHSDQDLAVASGVEPAESAEDSSPTFAFDLRENAQERTQDRIDHYLDGCVDQVLENPGCPVSISPSALNDMVGVEYDFDDPDAQWEITEYPTVELILGTDEYESPLFSFETESPGEAELTVTAEDSDGSTDMTFQCSFMVDLLEPTLEFDGEMYIGPLENVRDRPNTDVHVDDMDCEPAS